MLNELNGVRGEASLQPMLRRMAAADYPATSVANLEAIAFRTHYVDRRGRLQPLFDPALVKLLETFEQRSKMLEPDEHGGGGARG